MPASMKWYSAALVCLAGCYGCMIAGAVQQRREKATDRVWLESVGVTPDSPSPVPPKKTAE